MAEGEKKKQKYKTELENEGRRIEKKLSKFMFIKLLCQWI